MAESKTPKKLPFGAIRELIEQFDNGDDMCDYLDMLPEAQFDVDIKKMLSAKAGKLERL